MANCKNHVKKGGVPGEHRLDFPIGQGEENPPSSGQYGQRAIVSELPTRSACVKKARNSRSGLFCCAKNAGTAVIKYNVAYGVRKNIKREGKEAAQSKEKMAMCGKIFFIG